MSIEDELFSAVKDGNKSRVEFLLNENSACINARDEQGNTLLHIAVLYGYYSMIGLLMKKMTITQSNSKNYIGQTPLHLAVLSNDFAMVNTLLELCLKPDIEDTNGNLPIHLAAEMSNVEIIKLLYADKDTINKKNKYGLTPLHIAVQKECKEAVEVLICGGADIDIQDGSEKGDTALIMAVKKDHISIVELLLHRGADYNKTNNAKETFGAFAVSEEMVNIVRKYDELTDFLIPSTSGLLSCKRKTLSDVSNTNSSNFSSSAARICQRRSAIDEISDSPVSCITNYSSSENGKFLDTSSISSSRSNNISHTFKRQKVTDKTSHSNIDSSMLCNVASLTHKRKRSCISSSSSSASEYSDNVYSHKLSKTDNQLFSAYRHQSDESSTTSSMSGHVSSYTLDISSPESNTSESLVSGCKNTLQKLNLHYSASNSCRGTKL
ncbi:ankyrin repeat domain-containing protein [Candidatus Mesenet endosymbiont of Agriotes lineatus]|uniref:ankyrin repeat domain-containing protein n=1 Tax=Candidatus Mesenet endosymbiont of Agriotes lineatus TaxID=3077948 RepID=UPI0030D0F4C6